MDPPIGTPPGHYYSPIPDLAQVRADAPRIFARDRRDLPGIDLNEPGQLALLGELVRYYPELPWAADLTAGLRYCFVNPYYAYGDAIFLYSMIRHARPRQIVEVGSGFSSALILDTNDIFFGGAIDCTFIEPAPERLLSLLRVEEGAGVQVLRTRVEQSDPHLWRALSAGDILVIDSSHVAKVGSDVNFLVHEVLPALAGGVYVHIHDIFYPFEYPEGWVMRGVAWSEAYLLRAFLQYNTAFEIVLFTHFLQRFHREWFAEQIPLCLLNGGATLWLRRR